METMLTLKISPQGQITIPKLWQKVLKVKPGSKIIASLTDLIKTKALILKPEPRNWVGEVAGTGKGLWGNSEQYLKNERNSWKK